jgi:hypothetical protein
MTLQAEDVATMGRNPDQEQTEEEAPLPQSKKRGRQ